MSEEPLNFPLQLSPGVRVATVACPLTNAQRAALIHSGFKLPAELASAVAVRQQEFEAGRYCALQALLQAGTENAPPIGILVDRSPAWPPGYAGSIAHSHGRATAAVALTSGILSLGIDFETVMDDKQASRVRERILLPADERVVSSLNDWSESERVTLVFSAKEAIYKCLRPLCGEFFGFEDAELTLLDEASGTFRFVLTKPIGGDFAAGWTGQGSFAKQSGWVYTAMELTRI